LAPFLDVVYDKRGLSAPNASALPRPDVGELSATRHELFSRTPLKHAKPDCWIEGLFSPTMSNLLETKDLPVSPFYAVDD